MSALFRKCGLLAVAVLLPLLLSGCPKYALTVQVTGQGSVAVDPAGGPYKKNSSVTLTPAPAAGWHFDRWEGDLTGSASPASVVMDAAKTVTAVFVENPFALTILVTGQGTVTADPAGGSHAAGTTVTLTPVPAAGWHFDHWEGDLSGAANPASVVMDAAKTVTAVFAVDQYPLTILVTGQGTVAADPAGNPHTTGTTVTLTPAPAAGWHFDHWEGDLSGSATPGLVVMDAPKTVTAVFAETLYALNVTITGGGTVALNPPGGAYAPGTQVTLSATPDTGWHFDEWQGDLSGGATWIQVTMDAAKSVTAVFEREEYTLTVLPTDGGSVTLDPPGGTYPYETLVTLTPRATASRYGAAHSPGPRSPSPSP